LISELKLIKLKNKIFKGGDLCDGKSGNAKEGGDSRHKKLLLYKKIIKGGGKKVNKKNLGEIRLEVYSKN